MHIDEFLGIQATHNPHRWVLPITQGISTLGNFMFGGCGLATAVTAPEHTTGRPLIWATTQYLSYGKTGSILDLDVRVPVEDACAAVHVALEPALVDEASGPDAVDLLEEK